MGSTRVSHPQLLERDFYGSHLVSKRLSQTAILVVSSLSQTDASTKLLIEKGLTTQAEFMQKLSAERAVYQAMVEKMR